MSPCILWDGAVQSRGYGSMTDGHGGTVLVHRAAWELAHGTIPEGMTIDHLCRNKLCINTAHMEVVTRGENVRRALASMTHCKRNHPLSGANLRVQNRGGRDFRVCRECARIHNENSRTRRMERAA